MDRIAVVVSIQPRVIAFGYVDKEEDLHVPYPVLYDARMCVMWGLTNKGVVNLAHDGPNENSRVTTAVSRWVISPKGVELDSVGKVTSFKPRIEGYFVCTPQAIKAWEAKPWC
jgi:hypothetical protein